MNVSLNQQKAQIQITKELNKMISLDTKDIGPHLETNLGNYGIEYIIPQFEILRKARGLPKDIDDEKLMAPKFFMALKLIELWIDPMQYLLELELGELENSYRENQNQLSFLLKETETISWSKALNHQNPRIPDLIKTISEQKKIIEEKRLDLMTKSTRLEIINLLGLMLYPHANVKELSEAIALAHETYYGPNTFYKKSNKYTDALIFVKAAIDIFQKTKALPKTAEGDEFGKIFRSLRNLKEMEEIEDLYREIKTTNTFSTNGLTMRQLTFLFSRVLQRGISPSERGMFNGSEFYLDSQDKYRIDKVLSWIMVQLYGPTISTAQEVEGKAVSQERRFLFGLTILDKHKNTETLGNLPTESLPIIEALLSIFHELKQSNSFMEAAGFELTEQIFGIPDQAWLYDFSGIKSEILRSTMLLVSDRVPKFDLLEACQRFSTEVLSARVDRNDLRVRHLGGQINNYIQTNLLPKESWSFVGEAMVKIIEEVLIHEEDVSRKILKQIFAEEDRSHLITSKKFQPAYMTHIQFELGKDKTYQPQVITIYTNPKFDFQYRHAQNAGYPWYFHENELMRRLFEVSLGKKENSIPKQAMQLRKVITKIDNEKFILYYEVSAPKEVTIDIYQITLTCLAFKEVPEFTEGITPVEVLFRPKKFIERKPEDNGLQLLIMDARATDPKDLESIISNL